MTYTNLKTQIEKYLAYIQGIQMSANSVKAYERALNLFAEWYKEKKHNEVSLLTIEQFKTYLIVEYKGRKDRKLTPRSINNYVAILCSLVKHLSHRAGVIEPIDTSKVKLLPEKQNKKPVYITGKEFKRIVESIGGKKTQDLRDKSIFYVLFFTGLRIQELLDLKTEQIIEARDKMRAEEADELELLIVGKGGKERTIYLNYFALNQLMKYLKTRTDTDERLYTTNRHAVFEMVKKRANNVGVPNISPHALRHSFAVLFLDRGGKLNELKDIMGHAQITTTMIYLELAQKDLKRGYHKVFSNGIIAMLNDNE